MPFIFKLLATTAIILLPANAYADPGNGKGKFKPEKVIEKQDYKDAGQAAESIVTDMFAEDDVVEGIFTALEKELIGDYFRDVDRSSLPPGLAKRDSLPPGLQKQLDETGRLPPGLEKRYLPDDLRSKLPRRDDAERLIVGDDVYLIQKGTELVLDVLKDIL